MICCCAALKGNVSERTANLFGAGITLFSGSIYALVLTRYKLLGVFGLYHPKSHRDK